MCHKSFPLIRAPTVNVNIVVQVVPLFVCASLVVSKPLASSWYGVHEPKCYITYEASYENKCETSDKKACHTTYETLYRQQCSTSYENVCEDTNRTEYKQECSIVNEKE